MIDVYTLALKSVLTHLQIFLLIYKHINISDDKHFKAFKAFVQASSQRLTVSIVNLSVLVTLQTKGSVKGPHNELRQRSRSHF